jgi:two-component system phosphate regulon sensor histidine kinase PhoR
MSNRKKLMGFLSIQFIIIVALVFNTAPLTKGVFAFGWLVASSYTLWKVHLENANRDIRMKNEIDYQVNKAKLQAEKSSLQLRRLVNTLGSGVILIDAFGKIKIENQTFLSMFQLDSFLHKDYELIQLNPTLYQPIFDAYTAETSKRVQIKYQERFYDLIMTTINDEDTFQGLLVLVNDITEIKIAEQFQKQFTADVSHELKTPLSAIIGIAEMIQDKKVDEKKQEEFIDTLYKEATRLQQMIQDLLVISRLDRIDVDLIRKPTSIQTLIESSVKLLRNAIESKDLKLNIDVENALLNIDEKQFYQAIVNLLTNAKNYTDKGSITVKGRMLKDVYQLEFIDTGIGIAEDQQPYVFKRFYRIDEARSRDSGGTGLGLSIAKNVVLKHGGQILLASQKGKGSKFTIILPV